MWRDSESDQDFLNFTDLADQIATLATSPDLLPVSIGVFGTWGTGKSTVLRLVESRLASADPKPIVVKFDAWLYQGFDDAKAALMEVVADRLLTESQENQSLFTRVKIFAGRVNYFRALGMAADVGLGMAFGVPPGLLTRAGSAISALIAGKADTDAAETAKDVVKEAVEDWSKLIRPEKERTPPKEIAEFRQEFGEILKELKRPLILFIDNLDRCLPDVAISTLEAVRLFLFIDGTAFVIAADEDMIRHSVAKHFSDLSTRHVHDYLDKVIQVPMRVPQVGSQDVRAYMYSLFVGKYAKGKLPDVQACLLKALQDSWQDKTFTRDEIDALAGKPVGLSDALAVCDRLAPILASAPTINGNPRIVKRLLNAITLRQTLSASRKMNIDLATLSKLAVFERSTDGAAAHKLYSLVMEDSDAAKHLVAEAKIKESRPDLPTEWKKHEIFISAWREMEPHFENPISLRPAVFLSRDVMVPAVNRIGLSKAAQDAFVALLKVNSVTSPAAKSIAESLSPGDSKAVMGSLIAHLREEDWTQKVEGIHGAVVLAQARPECAAELKAFASGLQTKTMNKGVKAVLDTTGFIS